MARNSTFVRVKNRTTIRAIRQRLDRVKAGGGEAAVAKHTARGKLFVRDRIDTLLDEGAPFLEFGALAAHDMYDGQAPSAGVVTGVGRVAGQLVMVIANDATVKGGTYFPITVKKVPPCYPPRESPS